MLCGRTWIMVDAIAIRNCANIYRLNHRGGRREGIGISSPCSLHHELHVGWWRWVTDSDRWGQGSGDIVLTNTRNRARWAGLALARFWYFCTIKNPSAA